MPKPNRIDRQLHWRIELFKTLWATAVAGIGATVTLSIAHIGGLIMGFALIASGAMLALAVGAAVIVILTIKKLPDD